MIAGIPTHELIWLTFALLGAGSITGLLAGVFGVGGGAVIVPVLYELFGLVGVPDNVRTPLCVGTSLAVIIPTSIRSFYAHRARGAVDTSILKDWAITVVLGVIAGSVIARYAPAALFKIVFVVVAGTSSIRLLSGKSSRAYHGDMPSGPLMKFVGFVIGLLSSLMGIGGGQLSNLFMTYYGRSIHQAVATSSGLGIIVSIPGTVGYMLAGWSRAAEYPNIAALQFPLAVGYVSLLGLLLFVPTAIFIPPLGARLAHAMSKRKLEVAFGLFLLIVSVRFLINLLGG